MRVRPEFRLSNQTDIGSNPHILIKPCFSWRVSVIWGKFELRQTKTTKRALSNPFSVQNFSFFFPNTRNTEAAHETWRSGMPLFSRHSPKSGQFYPNWKTNSAQSAEPMLWSRHGLRLVPKIPRTPPWAGEIQSHNHWKSRKKRGFEGWNTGNHLSGIRSSACQICRGRTRNSTLILNGRQ